MKKRPRPESSSAPVQVNGLHRLGEIQLVVQIRHELVHIRNWSALLDVLDQRPDDGLAFEQLFHDFQFFGGRSSGAVSAFSPLGGLLAAC